MSRKSESLRAVRTPRTSARTIDLKFQCSSSAPANEQEAYALVRTALRAVLGRLGQASVPLLITEKENPSDEQSLSSEGFIN